MLWRRCTAWCPDVLKETAEVRYGILGVNLLNTFLGAPGVLEKKSGLLGGSCLTAGIPVASPFLTKGGEWVYEMHRRNTYILAGKTGSKRPPPKKSEGKILLLPRLGWVVLSVSTWPFSHDGLLGLEHRLC